MKISKILFISLVFVVASIYWSGVPTNVSAEEDDLIAQLAKPGTTITPVKPQFDCKMTEEKDKDGKIIVKLIGKDCEKVSKEVNSKQQQEKRGATCCVCRHEADIIVCRGNCCVDGVKAAFISLRR